jgi:hypothetical protein
MIMCGLNNGELLDIRAFDWEMWKVGARACIMRARLLAHEP